ncbi:hypothetical protein GGS26DRAFT_321214 [Hypomontagnella submonticulosa]|nr:hypothetical protein GGS26DRAFT_321214 [Hypomontagnella submonticulosa]
MPLSSCNILRIPVMALLVAVLSRIISVQLWTGTHLDVYYAPQLHDNRRALHLDFYFYFSEITAIILPKSMRAFSTAHSLYQCDGAYCLQIKIKECMRGI